MKAWQVPVLGEPQEVMTVADIPVPEPGPGQLRIRVRATALNFPDAMMVRGQYQDKPELPFTPGIEACGVVDSAGSSALPIGTRVMGVVAMPNGALAEYALVAADGIAAAPDALGDDAAAAFTIAYQTGWVALHRRARLQAGETLLVHAAAGGVGSAAVQLGKAAGARVIGVVGSADKVAVARSSGADEVIDRSACGPDELVTAMQKACGPGGADVVYDPVGGDAFRASMKVIAFEGRILVVGFAGGTVPQVAANHALLKNYGILGVYWGLYRLRAPEVIKQAAQALSVLLEAGKLKPVVSSVIEFDEAPAGLAVLGAGRSTGRIVVRIS